MSCIYFSVSTLYSYFAYHYLCFRLPSFSLSFEYVYFLGVYLISNRFLWIFIYFKTIKTSVCMLHWALSDFALGTAWQLTFLVDRNFSKQVVCC